MITAIYIVFILALLVFIFLTLRAREKIRELIRENQGLIADRNRLNRECRQLASQLSAEALHGTQARLAAKLNEARAAAPARDERLKHQNNEMRVFMSAVHRHLDTITTAVRGVIPDAENERRVYLAVAGALGHWGRVNDWLSKNTIEPYTGTVPGVPQEKQA